MLEAATPFNTLDKFDFFSDVIVACTALVVAEDVIEEAGCRAVCPAVLGSKITPEE